MLGLIASLSLNWVLPAFDHHAAEYGPFHAHLLLGAGMPIELAHALAAHAHGAARPHSHGPADTTPKTMDPASAAAVIGTPLMDGLTALVASIVHIIVVTDWPLPQPAPAVWLMLVPAAMLLRQRFTPPPEQPPRSP